jgi:hypothetical protein
MVAMTTNDDCAGEFQLHIFMPQGGLKSMVAPMIEDMDYQDVASDRTVNDSSCPTTMLASKWKAANQRQSFFYLFWCRKMSYYHEWQQSIGVIWNKHWTFGA